MSRTGEPKGWCSRGRRAWPRPLRLLAPDAGFGARLPLPAIQCAPGFRSSAARVRGRLSQFLCLKQPCLVLHGRASCSCWLRAPPACTTLCPAALLRKTAELPELRAWFRPEKEEGNRGALFPFLRQVSSGLLHASLPWVQPQCSWCGGGLRRRGHQSSPGLARGRYADATPAFPFQSTPAVCNPPLLKCPL